MENPDEELLFGGAGLVELLVSSERDFAVVGHIANARHHEVDFWVAEIDRAPLLSPAFDVAVVVARVARSRQLLDFFAQKVAHLLQRNGDEQLDHRDFGIGRQGVLIVIPPACLPPRGKAGNVLRLRNLHGHSCSLNSLESLEDRSHLLNFN
ncbi:hypothetical protein DWB58_19685 [candidate division KSB1 bacterium]|nr:hypothetical protein [candidate division KSB1 bacterium]